MSTNVLSFIITHGNLAESFVSVAKQLTSENVEMRIFSNSIKSLDELGDEISEIIKQQNPEKLVFFIDLTGGSCWMLGNRLKHKFPNAHILAGVNVAMLVSFQINYNRMEWDDLMEKVVADGKKGINHR